MRDQVEVGRRIVMGLALAGLAGGCEKAPSGPPIALADVCGTIAQEQLAALACVTDAPCTPEERVANTDCTSLAGVEDAVKAGNFIYDGGKLAACHAAFMANPCKEYPDTLIRTHLLHCPGALTPNTHEGGACHFFDECTDGFYCDHDTTCTGQCRRSGGEGAPCPSDYKSCAAGLECKMGVCARHPGKGSPCEQDPDCYCQNCDGQTELLWCEAGTKTCQPLRQTGERCGDDGTGASAGACAQTLWCDYVPGQVGTCRPRNGQGGSCREHWGCSGELHCTRTGATDTGGRCVKISASGEACQFPPDCAKGLTCVKGVCTATLPVGAACDDPEACGFRVVCAGTCLAPACSGAPCGPDDKCTFGTCKNGQCGPRLAYGEPCPNDDACRSGSCDATKGVCIDGFDCVP
jgi:hypothetical protein